MACLLLVGGVVAVSPAWADSSLSGLQYAPNAVATPTAADFNKIIIPDPKEAVRCLNRINVAATPANNNLKQGPSTTNAIAHTEDATNAVATQIYPSLLASSALAILPAFGTSGSYSSASSMQALAKGICSGNFGTLLPSMNFSFNMSSLLSKMCQVGVSTGLSTALNAAMGRQTNSLANSIETNAVQAAITAMMSDPTHKPPPVVVDPSACDKSVITTPTFPPYAPNNPVIIPPCMAGVIGCWTTANGS